MTGVEQAKEFIMQVLIRNVRNLRLSVESYHLKVEESVTTTELHEAFEMISYWVDRVENNQRVLEQLEEEL